MHLSPPLLALFLSCSIQTKISQPRPLPSTANSLKMSTKSAPSSGSGSGPGKPPGAAKWCEIHKTTSHNTADCNFGKRSGIVKTKPMTKEQRIKMENRACMNILRTVASHIVERDMPRFAANSSGQAAPIAANTPGQAVPSAANDNVDPRDAAKGSDEDPNAAKDPKSGG
ncbi:hypothetical protein KCU95_g493, partial [Aureobasidium melanogenum]